MLARGQTDEELGTATAGSREHEGPGIEIEGQV